MKKRILFFINCFCLLLFSCSDQWLEVKRDISLTVPSTLDDIRALLNIDLLRYDNIGLAEESADEYEVTDITFNARTPRERAAYLWEKNILDGVTMLTEWDDNYKQIFQCNVALDALLQYHPDPSEQHLWNLLYGEALFFRAKTFFNLAQLFAAPYDATTVDQKEGIPLRLTADVNEKTTRSSLRQTYDQILLDLTTASLKLDAQPLDVRQTSKPAAFSALARCYLVMHDYEKAGQYADSSLQINPALLDFNALTETPTYPIAPYNVEVNISTTLFPPYAIFNRTNAYIPTAVYDLYEDNDLRKTIFFYNKADGTIGFTGSYLGTNQFFHGTTSSEMYLIRAECAARAGNISNAVADLNSLREKRYRSIDFTPLTAVIAEDVIQLILLERRRELIRRGLRWQDLRRLNQEPNRSVTISRTVSGVTYSLPPNDPRYVMPIPDYIIQATGIKQNIR
ncbi:SusD family protein [bacterium A37T11]|nr:SusD family protein [bacterium A37T11]